MRSVAAMTVALLAALPCSHAAAQGGDMVARGKYLVYAGDCAACHTAPGGAEFAGGVAISSPFGTMYSPNITPDKDTGIGNWSDDQFYRAFHEGRDDQGNYLYPAFPYPWFTKVTRADVLAIKEYLFTLPAVHSAGKRNELMFPLGFRPVMIGWNMMFFKAGEFQPDPTKSDAVNRGAYLVEGLGHCSDCHTPKNALQGPENGRAFAGGVVDHWYAPNISGDTKQGVGGWADADLKHYLKTGVSATHGVVLGPMAQAVHESLAHLTDADLTDIVAYLKSTKPQAGYAERTPVLATDARPGAAIYASYCASCHQQNGQGVKGRIPSLTDNGAVLARGPENVIRVVVGGLRAQGSYGPMPGFGTVMSDEQIADISNFVRTAWSNKAPGSASPDMVSAIAKETRGLTAGTAPCPPLGSSALDGALADPAVQDTLKGIDEGNLTQGANRLAAKLKAAVPGAPIAAMVNEATDAYCPVLAARTDVDASTRWFQLNVFGETLYTQLVEHGRD